MAVDYRVSGDAFIEAPHDFRPETMDREYRYEQQRTRKVAWNVATRCFTAGMEDFERTQVGASEAIPALDQLPYLIVDPGGSESSVMKLHLPGPQSARPISSP
jgi:hypothetical protein